MKVLKQTCGFMGFQLISTDNGFHLKSGLKKRLSTQTMFNVDNCLVKIDLR